MRKVILLLFAFVLVMSVVYCNAADPVTGKKVIMQKKGNGFRLGVIIANPDEDFLKERNLDGGALVLDVIEDSPAEKAGIEEDDIIIRFDGKEIEEPEDLADMMEKIEEEKDVSIVVNRAGQDKSFKVSLKKAEKGEHQVTVNVDDDDIDVLVDEAMRMPHVLRQFRHIPPGLPGKGGYLGVRGTELSDQLKEYFEVEHGILVEEIIKDSPAEKAGLKAGDVIYQINDRKIEDFEDLIRTINYFNPDEQITVYYVRKGKKGSVKVTLDKKKGPDFEPIRMPHRPEEFEHFFKNYPGPKHIKHFKKRMPMMDEDVEILIL